MAPLDVTDPASIARTLHMAIKRFGKLASVIYAAVTDGTKRLRYLAGDDVKHFVDARRRLACSALIQSGKLRAHIVLVLLVTQPGRLKNCMRAVPSPRA